MKAKLLMLHRQQSAVGYYRTWVPARYLAKQGYEVTWWEDAPYQKNMRPSLKDWLESNLGKYDLLMVDRCMDWEELGYFSGFRHYSPKSRMTVDFDDDFLNVPKWNMSYTNYQPGQLFYEVGRSHLRLAEMTTVSTPTLSTRFKHQAHAVRCVFNAIDPKDWTSLPVCPERAVDPHIRVLYGGAAGHYGDMDEAKAGIKAMIDNPPVPWRLICFGAIPHWLHDSAREHPGRVVSLPWIPFSDYPQAVAWGGFDAAIAPLAQHPFNEAKSNIKWLEAAVQKIPFLCSDVGPYKAEIPDGCAIKISNTPVQWAEGLRNLLVDKNLRQRLATRAYEAVLDCWTIDQKGQIWENIVEEALTLPRIETLEDTRLPGEPS